MKHHHLLPTLLILLLTLSCQHSNTTSSNTNTHTNDLDTILAHGVLRAVCDYNTVNYFFHKGVPVGYQYELLSQYAQYHNLKLQIIPDNTLQGAYQKLQSGKANIIASTLLADSTMLPPLALCEPYGQSRIVLVNHAPAPIPSDLAQLQGDTIYLMAESFYSKALDNILDTANFDIHVVPVKHYDAEQLVGLVAEQEIKQTLCLESIARASQWYYDSLQIGPALTPQTNMSWAVLPDAQKLQTDISQWMKSFRRTSLFKRIYRKYVIDPREHHNSAQSTKADTYQSDFHDIIMQTATDPRYNWRLLTSIIYQESHFNPQATSWAGATGLMQLMPETAARFGAVDPTDPTQNIQAGYEFLLWLDNRLVSLVPSPTERVKFTLAAYNVGLGHIMDAIRLAQKFNRDPQTWHDNVETALLLKANPTYYSDPAVQHGFCRGTETVSYVKNVIDRYNNYKSIPE